MKKDFQIQMNIQQHKIIVKKSARFFSNEIYSSDIKSVWIVLHGYAQLAKDFINEFDFLSDEDTLIIAAEGLSKFYFRNKIAASWMTKEDRSNEINDYINYLDKVIEKVKTEFNLSGAKINLLGFSQGVHTAARWFINSDNYFDNLILCSSDFPKDADFKKLKSKLEDSKIFFVYGSKDEIINEQKIHKNRKLLKDNEIDFEEIIFGGKHEINKDSLAKIANK
ncbi:MAG: hypothetical protein M3R36_05355 [Bacteroidota bacterium]|nr:hypothetical protein [Bacteroidota bacterium]